MDSAYLPLIVLLAILVRITSVSTDTRTDTGKDELIYFKPTT